MVLLCHMFCLVPLLHCTLHDKEFVLPQNRLLRSTEQLRRVQLEATKVLLSTSSRTSTSSNSLLQKRLHSSNREDHSPPMTKPNLTLRIVAMKELMGLSLLRKDFPPERDSPRSLILPSSSHFILLHLMTLHFSPKPFMLPMSFFQPSLPLPRNPSSDHTIHLIPSLPSIPDWDMNHGPEKQQGKFLKGWEKDIMYSNIIWRPSRPFFRPLEILQSVRSILVMGSNIFSDRFWWTVCMSEEQSCITRCTYACRLKYVDITIYVVIWCI